MKNKTLIIDFDSTFIQTEALDELAAIALQDHIERDKIVDQICEITAAGMNGSISLSDSLARRLILLQANKKHLDTLIAVLNNKISHSFRRNTQFLKQFSDNIYIVSSGFKEYIIPIVSQFGIKKNNV